MVDATGRVGWLGFEGHWYARFDDSGGSSGSMDQMSGRRKGLPKPGYWRLTPGGWATLMERER